MIGCCETFGSVIVRVRAPLTGLELMSHEKWLISRGPGRLGDVCPNLGKVELVEGRRLIACNFVPYPHGFDTTRHRSPSFETHAVPLFQVLLATSGHHKVI